MIKMGRLKNVVIYIKRILSFALLRKIINICDDIAWKYGDLKNKSNTVNKTIGLLWKLENILPRGPLLTIYKSFIRPHLDYGDVICDQQYNNSFHQKLESIQYNAALAIIGALRGSSREKLYQELD